MPSKDGDIKEIVNALSEVEGDLTVPKNVRARIKEIIETLDSNLDRSLKVNKAQHQLDEIADDMNLNSYARTQIWNIASNLEKL